jgi:hypothetical protein
MRNYNKMPTKQLITMQNAKVISRWGAQAGMYLGFLYGLGAAGQGAQFPTRRERVVNKMAWAFGLGLGGACVGASAVYLSPAVLLLGPAAAFVERMQN